LLDLQAAQAKIQIEQLEINTSSTTIVLDVQCRDEKQKTDHSIPIIIAIISLGLLVINQREQIPHR
jgi:2-methylcitrate dehydratase PrpD